MYSYKLLTSLMVLYCALDSGLFSKLPEYIKVCKRDQDTINECVPKTIEQLRPILKTGIKEIGVPGIDPLYIKQVIPAADSPMNIVGQDITVTGAGNFSLKKLDIDLDTMKINAWLYFPRLHLEGRYRVDTVLFNYLSIKGEGSIVGDAIKITANTMLSGAIKDRNGEDYLTFEKVALDVSMKDYNIKLGGLFQGDKVLGEVANQLINNNREEMLRMYKPRMEKLIGAMVLKEANTIVKGIPLDELLPLP